jgi:hypothetical protein
LARVPARLTVDQLADLLDRVVRSRYDHAVADVAEVRARYPSAGPAQVSQVLVRRAQRSLAAVAAMSGGAAAAPGIGTAVGLAAAGADAAWTMTRLAELVLAVGVAHGYDAPSLEERKAWVLATLAVANGATGTFEQLAGDLGSRGGIALVRRLGPARLQSLNSALLSKLAARVLATDSLLTLGNVLPFGIGAGIGAAGNAAITRSVGRAAIRLFSAGAPGSRPWYRRGAPRRSGYADVRVDDDVIDVEGVESGPWG